MTGPEVEWKLTPSSRATICAERRLAESRRTDEQHVIERLAARFGGLDEDAEILARRFLAGEIGEELRADRRLVLGTLLG